MRSRPKLAVNTDVPRRSGYVVPALPAIEVLERSNPAAARWWRDNAPHGGTNAKFIVRSFIRAVPVLSIFGMVGCTSPGISHAPMAAASGVARADAGKGPREFRIIPLKSMAGDVEILYGDPEVSGEPFVMRIRELPGAIVPPHFHPVDENITVVQGTWYFGLGEEYKAETLQELKAGSYAFAPKGSTMFGYSATGATVQVHGVGPFRIHWHGGLHTLDDPDAKSVFRFARDARVLFKSQNGRVAEGYASGKIVQYEIEAPDGQRFMASEHELRPQ